MLSKTFDFEKAINAVQYIAKKLGQPDYHKVFKTLYFADQAYIVEYGNSIVGDRFIKMGYGPVPSSLYDLFKVLDGRNSPGCLNAEYVRLGIKKLNAIPGARIENLEEPDMDFFAQTEIDILDVSVEKCRDMDFEDRKKLSHDSAWDISDLNQEMAPANIAIAGGASRDVISYLQESLENKKLLSI